MQKVFLRKIDKVLASDGLLLYCTCSLCKEEGEFQINEFLTENKQFEIVSFKYSVPDELKKIVTKEGFLRILPYHMDKFGGADGFFAALVKRVC